MNTKIILIIIYTTESLVLNRVGEIINIIAAIAFNQKFSFWYFTCESNVNTPIKVKRDKNQMITVMY